MLLAAPCVEELPEIIKLGDEYSKKNVKIVAITFEEKKQIQTFLKGKKTKNIIETYTYRDIIEGKFCSLFGYPMYMILDSTVKVVDVWSGGSISDPNHGFYKKVKALFDKNL
jgi:thiol-disulfide isomerase/thioredoxin